MNRVAGDVPSLRDSDFFVRIHAALGESLCRRYAARIFLSRYPGLTPRAHCAPAAARLFQSTRQCCASTKILFPVRCRSDGCEPLHIRRRPLRDVRTVPSLWDSDFFAWIHPALGENPAAATWLVFFFHFTRGLRPGLTALPPRRGCFS